MEEEGVTIMREKRKKKPKDGNRGRYVHSILALPVEL